MYYTVTTGDTLRSIAGKFDIDLSLLAQVNCIKETDYIELGRMLFIPNNIEELNSLNISSQIKVADAYPLPPIYFKEFEDYISSISPDFERDYPFDIHKEATYPENFVDEQAMVQQSFDFMKPAEEIISSDKLPKSIGIIPPYAQSEGLAAAIESVVCTSHLTYPLGTLNSRGELMEEIIPDVLMDLKKFGAKIIGGISNFVGSLYSSGVLDNVLSSAKTAQTIAQKVFEKGFTGVLVDFQPLKNIHLSSIGAFMGNLKHFLRSDPTIDVALSITPDDMRLFSKARSDMEELKQVVDFFVIQTYTSEAEPAAISSMSFFKEQAELAKDLFGADKVSISIGAYGLDWAEDSSNIRMITDEEASLLAPDMKMRSESEDGVSFTYSDDSGKHTVWYEDENSINRKLDYLRENDFRSITVWRMGSISKPILQQFAKF